MRFPATTLLLIATFTTATAWGQVGGTGIGIGTGTGQGTGIGQGIGENIGGSLQERGESTVGGTGFLNRSNNQGGFLGGAGAAQNTNFGNAGGFTAGGRGGGGGNTAGRGGQPQQQQSTRVIRTRITIPSDFGRVVVTPSQIQSRLNGQFRRASRLKRFSSRQANSTTASPVNTNGLRGSSVVATPNGRTVTLTGSVNSKRDRMLAEKMAKMEPGVDTVLNQIIVSN